MIRRPISTIAIVVCLLSRVVQCQDKSNPQDGLVHDDALGIAFAKIGTVEQSDSASYRITLRSSENSSARSGLAQISATDRLFVDLPGSYGGRLFLDTPSASLLLHDRIFIDSVNTGQQIFRREYWTVYAGMGMWEGVINCSTQQGGRYYIVSLLVQEPIGKPGEEVSGAPLKAGDLSRRLLNSLQDTTDVIVNEFTTLLTSVQIRK